MAADKMTADGAKAKEKERLQKIALEEQTRAAKQREDEQKKRTAAEVSDKLKAAKSAKNTRKERFKELMKKHGVRYAGTAAAVAVLAVGYHFYMARPLDLSKEIFQEAENSYMKGNVYLEQGQLKHAILHYKAALDKNPRHADCWTNLGNAFNSAQHHFPHYRESFYGQGVTAYENALAINPEHAEANFNMGVLHHTFEDMPRAIKAYERAIELNPQHYDAYSNLGSALHKEAKLDKAIHAYQSAIELVTPMSPELVDASQISLLYYLLGAALSALPAHRCKGAACVEHAAQKLRLSLKYNPQNEEAKHALSALLADPTVTTASDAYIKALFDEYAANFDKALVKDLNYTAPEKIFAVVSDLAAKARITKFKTVVDVGCGTGLCGMLFRNMTDSLVGVDLSSEMVDRAQEREVYDELYVEEISESLARYDNKTDKARLRAAGIIVAADVFVYSGDLERFFKGASRALKKGGWFALTLERLFRNETAEAELNEQKAAAEAGEGGDDEQLNVLGDDLPEDAHADQPKAQDFRVTDADLAKGWKLQLTGRFAHTEKYVTDLAAAHGFKVSGPWLREGVGGIRGGGGGGYFIRSHLRGLVGCKVAHRRLCS
jgi:predicted TPR repeat methyltransferase